ncbi:MAG: hypothetical protein K9K78_05735 [Spirochaetales bacterium]|nr:hypothetical protein [Spirochaetales bacterium]
MKQTKQTEQTRQGAEIPHSPQTEQPPQAVQRSQPDFIIYPLLSRIPGGCKKLPIRIEAASSGSIPAELKLTVQHLQHNLWETVLKNQRDASALRFEIPLEQLGLSGEFRGLRITAASEKKLAETSIDFAGGPIRYGFVSDFTPSDSHRTAAVIKNLLRNHITHVQFYDWNYRPHQFAPDEQDTDMYRDTMGKEISFSTLKKLIADMKRAGIRALGYGAVYAAANEYLADHRHEALEDIDGKLIDLIGKFFIMNLGNREWRKRILEQYEYAIEHMGFDGIHMDTYGYPKSGWGYASDDDTELKQYDLQDQFVSFINAWARHGDENIFNNVGGWPVMETGKADQAASYIEVWEPHTKYHHLRTLIQGASSLKKPVILAAYLEPFKLIDEVEKKERKEESEPAIESEKNAYDTIPQGALMSAELLTAAVSSLGASSLLLGEEHAVLTQPYYSDYALLSPAEQEEIRRYYDHQVRCEELFYDPELTDITESHGLGENREFSFIFVKGNIPVSHDGRAGSIWLVIRRTSGRLVLNLINLIDQSDDEWNRVKKPCITKPDVRIQIPRYSKHMSVYACSPDADRQEITLLPHKLVSGIRGPSVEVTLKELPLWMTIWCEL